MKKSIEMKHFECNENPDSIIKLQIFSPFIFPYFHYYYPFHIITPSYYPNIPYFMKFSSKTLKLGLKCKSFLKN